MSRPIPYKPPVKHDIPAKRIVLDFPSWPAYLEHLAKTPEVSGLEFGSWSGDAKSFDEVKALATYGWPAGAQHVKDVAMPLAKSVIARSGDGHTWGWDVTGAAF